VRLRYHHFEKLGSTQDQARALLDQGEAPPFLITADEQSAGHGRLGRTWISPRGNFYGSLAMRPAVDPARYGEYSFLTAAALLSTIGKFSKGDITLKWPNDILLGGKKCAGVLIESCGAKNEILIIGMGVNLRYAPPVQEVPKPTAALWPEAPLDVKRDKRFTKELMKNFIAWHRRYENRGFEVVRNEWAAYAHHLGQPITVETPRERLEGVFTGIDAQGNLLLTQDGETRKVTAADVSLS